ncbi:uncharacterized protein LOC108105398 [Drosophila eugracilis]|uniref:uncharacterized protein LOC108105398 n=1 Tax=Drosophila eugracilis TaxID=29029 RepID=UPI0007E7E5B2|nr:uncharacterized protein LOC108105398 [Drosophila eugracilis]
MLLTKPSLSAISTYLRLEVRNSACRMTGRLAYSTGWKQETNKDYENLSYQRDEPNPEYHHAPRCFVRSFQKHQEQTQERDERQTIRFRNPRYRWADFRRRMVYGTYDI